MCQALLFPTQSFHLARKIQPRRTYLVHHFTDVKLRLQEITCLSHVTSEVKTLSFRPPELQKFKRVHECISKDWLSKLTTGRMFSFIWRWTWEERNESFVEKEDLYSKIFFPAPHSLWDLSSLTRDRTRAQWKSCVQTTDRHRIPVHPGLGGSQLPEAHSRTWGLDHTPALAFPTHFPFPLSLFLSHQPKQSLVRQSLPTTT